MKFTGKEIQTIRVSLDEILNCLEKVLEEVEVTEIKDIEKVVKGWFWSSLRTYDTKNEKYRIVTIYVWALRSKALMNDVSIVDIENGKIYTYKSFLFNRKFKKAAKKLVNKYKAQ